MIPDDVLASWAELAEHNEESQARFHSKHHFADRSTDECWRCQRERAVCKSKVRFETLEEAEAVYSRLNVPDGQLLVPYRCRWGQGLHFHNRTARSTGEKSAARKRMGRLALRRSEE